MSEQKTTHNVLLRDARPEVDPLGLVEAVQERLPDELDAGICAAQPCQVSRPPRGKVAEGGDAHSPRFLT